jgi:20S proteasome subunit alpha 5
LTQSICDLALGFGEGRHGNQERAMSRPFGVALLMAGVDEKGPQLFFSDPSGTYTQYKAKAIGAGSEGAQSTLQDKFRDDMTLQDAEVLSCEVLKQVMEEKISNQNIEVAAVTAKVRNCLLNLTLLLPVSIFSQLEARFRSRHI